VAATRHPRILEQEEARERRGEAEEEGELVDGLVHAPAGLSDVAVEEAGRMRVAAHPIEHGGRRLGTLYVADRP
jgi:hypothetical protein